MFAAANGFKIIQLPEAKRIYILSGGAARSWRVIYMDGRPHPDVKGDTYNPGYMGHSVGRWEGDTLVVDTVDPLYIEQVLVRADGTCEVHVIDVHTDTRIDVEGKVARSNAANVGRKNRRRAGER